ncbi:outer membrane beta-barrel protein [Pelomicrobium methylotrophicum]|uniref:Outer membrane beta-barrel protein n=1 Tax=Pelomicrobium methylotrophicum TaxID=2602750 RepID=A0A5C7EN64_9PROT|nr:outer membrane beta-barrel protein [Pelomicrobium methylotrophicum]TXF13029.1 outer membrane beta-barrel protein [Pelomicrobium methylotrophicum]
MMLKSSVLALAAVGLVSAVPPAIAADQPAGGGYIGASLGQSKINDVCDGIVGTCDDKDTGWKIFGGYQFNRYFAVEGGYVDFGKATATDVSLGTPISGDAEGWGLFATGLAALPINEQFGVFAKAGLAYTKADVTVVVGGVSVSDDDSGTDLVYGVGAKFDFTKNFGMRVEFERFKDVGNSDSDVDLLSAGLVYKF